MSQTARTWAKIGAGFAGGVIGLCIGPVTGSMLAANIAGATADPGPSEMGRWLGMGAGLVGGAFLGAFLVGRPVVARWCLGMAFAVGAVAFLAGFAGPILLTPDSPQGPLLGIFITGPLGFLAGAVIGLGIGLTREGRRPA